MTSKIRIVARLRPSITGEVDDGAVAIHRDETGSFVTVTHPRDRSQQFKYPFSSSYGRDSTQEEIYVNDVFPLLDVVFSGVTVTVFAYGVTSSGKTHTIQGSKEQPGIIPRVVNDIMSRSEDIGEVVTVSYMEIYKEEVYDLLVDRDTAPKLPVRENEAGQVFVAKLSRVPISSVEDFEEVYSAATKRRSTGSTNLNRVSSRSHAVLTLYLQMEDPDSGQTTTGKINLVDLAGSENNKLTGNDPSRMAESAAINKSLSVLGQVVHALNRGASRVPYRNSKLTRILQDALGGSAVGLLICNLAPGARFRQDTWNTLNFATRTKEIENKPVVNVRDTQPAPKPHFAAAAQPPTKLPAANIPITKGQSGRPSLLLTSGGSSKLPGPSKISAMKKAVLVAPAVNVSVHRPTPLNSILRKNKASRGSNGSRRVSHESGNGSQKGSIFSGLTEEEIDERISKIVELEVSRRLEERERKREADEVDKQRRLHEEMLRKSLAPTPDLLSGTYTPASLPSGVLTPLLKRHQDLDNELKRRLAELEQKHDQSNQEAHLADVLSPSSKKKTGRAYVALALAHSEASNLEIAYDLYKKAEFYIPNNRKLKERTIEIEYCIENGVEFIPESKRKRGKTGRKSGSSSSVGNSSVAEVSRGTCKGLQAVELGQSDFDSDTDEFLSCVTDDHQHHVQSFSRNSKSRFRRIPLDEATNSPQTQKRYARSASGLEAVVTPPKKARKQGSLISVISGDSDGASLLEEE